MLILARKIHEAIMISSHIRIEIVGIEHGIIKLGIDAPLDIPVHREEVYRRIKRSSGGMYLPQYESYL